MGLSDNPRAILTLLWILINICILGFLFTSFFSGGGGVRLGLCIPPSRLPPSPPLSSNTSSYAPSSSPTSYNDSNDEPVEYDDGNQGFVQVWTTLMLIALSIGGTMVLRSYRTPFAIGGFAGCILGMANLMFMLSATSAGELRRRSKLGMTTPADKAGLVFSVLEFLLLAAFGLGLLKYRKEVFNEDDYAQDGIGEGGSAAHTSRGI